MRQGSVWIRWGILSSGFDCNINVYIMYSIYDMLVEDVFLMFGEQMRQLVHPFLS